MRRLLALAALSVLSASVAAFDAAAAPNPGKGRSAQSRALGCEVMRSGFIDVRNTTRRTIPKGTRIDLVVLAGAGARTAGVRKSVTTRQELSPGLYHAFAPVPRDAKSCTATLRMPPDHLGR